MPPDGGARDATPPKILNRAEVDSLLNFTGGTLEIEFNEYIKIQDLQTNFQISPLTERTPKVSVKKKNLIIELPDSLLQSSTTYTLNFGSSVKDLREGNVFPDLRIIFSTGAYFDSLSLTGKIIDAQSGQADTILAMLYPIDIDDSMLLKQKPLYVARASGGVFSFTGLPAKKFKLAALSDKNANYIYDARGEKIAFYKKIIDLQKLDSAITMYSFLEESMRDTTIATTSRKSVGGRLNNTSSSTGRPSGKFNYTFEPNIESTEKIDIQDTLKIKIGDTNAIVNPEKIRFYEDSILDLSMTVSYDDSLHEITLLPDWKMGANYMVVVQSAFLKDTSATGTEADTINFSTMAAEDFGSISVKLDSSLYKNNSVLQLVLNGEVIKKQAATLNLMRFDLLRPSSYNLRLLYDENENGIWDSGNLKERTLPEVTIELPQTIILKPNWEEKVEWEMGTKKARLGMKEKGLAEPDAK